MLVDSTGGREFQSLGDATGKLRAPNAVLEDGMVSRLVLEDLREQAGVCKNVCMQAVSNAKY